MEAEGMQEPRICVSCGRDIPWDASLCPYCGHDYRAAARGSAPSKPLMRESMKALLYLLSFLIPPVGMIVGVIYYVRPEPEYKDVGRVCVIISTIMFAIGAILVAAVFV